MYLLSNGPVLKGEGNLDARLDTTHVKASDPLRSFERCDQIPFLDEPDRPVLTRCHQDFGIPFHAILVGVVLSPVILVHAVAELHPVSARELDGVRLGVVGSAWVYLEDEPENLLDGLLQVFVGASKV